MKLLALSVLSFLIVGCGRSTAGTVNEKAAVPSPPAVEAPAGPVKTPEPVPTPPKMTPAMSKVFTGAASIIREYYGAINARQYETAYHLWSQKGEASGQTLAEFQRGFDDTASVTVEIDNDHGMLEGAAGSEYATVPVKVRAVTHDGRQQHFEGEYVLRRSMVDGATPEQQAWRIYSAKIRETGR